MISRIDIAYFPGCEPPMPGAPYFTLTKRERIVPAIGRVTELVLGMGEREWHISVTHRQAP